jgi:leucyl/phenylalanyl-tRNA--protein transferase
MHRAYVLLHEAGYAHSFEAYAANGDLVGGLYGVAINGIFCGESMFARADDASKIAFVYALAHLRSLGFTHVDCQVHTAHLERFGAQPWERNDFLDLLQAPAESPARIGLWNFDATIDILVEAFIADLSIDE